jgi:hypothetical protein
MSNLTQIVKLGETFGLQEIRNYTHDGRTYASVLDAFSAVSGTPKQTWDRFKKSYPEVLVDVHSHQFPGPRQRQTPVAEGPVIIEMILKLPGAKAREFSSTAANAFIQALNPTREYIDALTDRADELESGAVSGPEVLVTTSANVINRFTRNRSHDETTVYIRVRKPEEFTVPSEYVKQLTLMILKFGLTYYLHGRDGQYGRDIDNGYMLFGIQCADRKQAKIIEDILIADFSEAAVLGSREYVDVATVASILGCEYEPDSYASYVSVAQQLYAYILQRIHVLWPRTSHLYGCSYDIIVDNSTLVRSTEDDSVVMHSDLSFRCNVIDEARALQLGLVKPQPVQEVREAAPVATRDPHPSTLRMLGGVEDRGALVAEDDGSVVTVTMKAKLDRFIEEMCDVDPRGTVNSKEISGQYRLWAREDGKTTFSAVLAYMSERFRYKRLEGQAKNTVVNGFFGVKLKPVPAYVLPADATLQERFLYETCDRGPEFKCVQTQLVQLFKEWMQKNGHGAATDFQVLSLVEFLKTNFFKANIWITNGSTPGQGMWGIGLQIHSHLYRSVPTTSKRVWMIDVSTRQVIPVDEHNDSWPTIALAAESRGWCTAKMSRAIDKGTVFDGVKYTTNV